MHSCFLFSFWFVVFCPQAAKAVLSQLKRLARALWSNPPTHGARIAAEVVGDAGMFEQWKGEVSSGAGSCAAQAAHVPVKYYEKCTGVFQCRALLVAHSIYHSVGCK
jgi:hypothetical protein